jgi:hypothetical protein
MYSYGHITEADQAEIWRLRDLGESISEIARRVGKHRPNIHWFLAAAGGRRPLHVMRSEERLSHWPARGDCRGLGERLVLPGPRQPYGSSPLDGLA